jgi:quercetin dioxygenase-like cupin family protein
MTRTEHLNGKVQRISLPAITGAPAQSPPGPKRLLLPQGELAHFYDGEEGIRYLAFVEFLPNCVRGNHYHVVKKEYVYIIRGKVELLVADPATGLKESVPLATGDLAIVPPGVAHAVRTIEAGEGVEFSPAPFNAQDVQPFRLT